MNLIRHIAEWLKKWFWTKPTSKPEPPKATDVVKKYLCFKYRDQWINLRIPDEVILWNQMSRHDRRGMAQKFATMERKGLIKFVEINGRMTCIKAKDYESKADNGQSHNGQARPGK
jgi:hypothetical protein